MSGLTSSVARLYRAGSEHSKSKQKLNEAAHDLVRWLAKNVPLRLPDNCSAYPSGEFIQMSGQGKVLIHLQPNKSEFSRDELFKFATLVAGGWLDRVSALLEAEKGKLDQAAECIASGVAEMEAKTKR